MEDEWCEMSCVSCVRGTTEEEEATEEAEEEEEGGAGSQRSKTKTPHKDVGKYVQYFVSTVAKIT